MGGSHSLSRSPLPTPTPPGSHPPRRADLVHICNAQSVPPCPKRVGPGEAFSTVWYVERIAQTALSINVSMSAGYTESAMSNSDVRIMVPKTWWACSQMAFAF